MGPVDIPHIGDSPQVLPLEGAEGPSARLTWAAPVLIEVTIPVW